MNIFFILVVILCLNGCEMLARNYVPDDLIKFEVTSEGYMTEEGQIDLEKVKITDFAGATNKNRRNRFIAETITVSDQKCNLHKAKILSNTNAWNVSTGSAAILFSGAASVVTNAQSAALLAAGASTTSGVQSLFNKEVYSDALGTTILRAIDVGRAKQKAIIELGMKNDNYDPSIAIVDLIAYHDSCSMMAGLVEVTKSLDNRKQSKNEIDRDIEFINKQLQNTTLLGLPTPEKDQIKSTLVTELKAKLTDRVKATD